MLKPIPLAWFLAAAVMAAAVFAPVANAQERLSLSERMTRLEQQMQGNAQGQSSSVELLNRLNELQQEVQNLRGTVEQQTNEIEIGRAHV